MMQNLNAEEKQAISELLSRAAFAYDEKDIEMLSASFSVDAQFTMRIADGDLIGPFEGREGIMKLMIDSMDQQTDKRRHVISNIFFESSQDNNVSVVSNLTLFATENGEIQLLSAGIYHDSVVKINDNWEVYRRHLDLDKSY
ncbi:MAG: nuclear transport factor 2 family protein [Dehalococcoidia bacterium]|nr:nuclear transport factor 2 family protein [Dehalococcoidia bacterium]|tara:strand:+ start:525 stop:950 length:426 start_codon:yes stop_codon:yes gene_type:complete